MEMDVQIENPLFAESGSAWQQQGRDDQQTFHRSHSSTPGQR
jgi:hypothetical protein